MPLEIICAPNRAIFVDERHMRNVQSMDWGVVILLLFGVFTSNHALLGNARAVFEDGSSAERIKAKVQGSSPQKEASSNGMIKPAEKRIWPSDQECSGLTCTKSLTSPMRYLLSEVAVFYLDIPRQEALYNEAEGFFNVWQPRVGGLDVSLASVMVCVETACIGAGWKVDPQLYGDMNPHVFVFMKNHSHTCYDTQCPGVFEGESDPGERIGLSLAPSVVHGAQSERKFIVYMDASGAWHASLRLTDDDPSLYLGRWPAAMIPALGQGARYVYWGGGIIKRRATGTGRQPPARTTTQMGSGRFPVAGTADNYQKTAYVRGLAVSTVPFFDPTEPLPGALHHYVTRPERYDVRQVAEIQGVRGFFYGGPDRD